MSVCLRASVEVCAEQGEIRTGKGSKIFGERPVSRSLIHLTTVCGVGWLFCARVSGKNRSCAWKGVVWCPFFFFMFHATRDLTEPCSAFSFRLMLSTDTGGVTYLALPMPRLASHATLDRFVQVFNSPTHQVFLMR